MSVSLSELQDVATDLIKEHLSTFEFLDIVEDSDLFELTEDEQSKLYKLILTADITATWEPTE